jgi:hypothetical protein
MVSFIERILFEPRGGQFREWENVNAFFTPKDTSLYSRLLPQPLLVPAQPTVLVYAADIYIVPWPTRYGEWSVLLLSSYQGREAWYPLTMPVTKWVEMKGGRHFGFPKYVVDTITVSAEGDTVVGTARHKGTLQLELGFSARLSRPLAPWEQAMAGRSWLDLGFHCLHPPGVGPRLLRVTLRHVVPPKDDIRQGMVTIRVDPDAPWVGLVPEGGAFAGHYHRFSGGSSMHAERLA